MSSEEQRESGDSRTTTTQTGGARPRASTQVTDAQSTTRDAHTQVGQVMHELGRLTRRLPTARAKSRRANNVGQRSSPASRERVASLVAALGDPSHPQHAHAVNELVTIGDAAVPALNEALNPQHPWLTSFRAAEALGQIGDGRAAGALSQALAHPNSNVRWSAVRALSQVGDARALFQLRRVAQDDRGKTSWGESVAGTAQSALDQMRSESVWGQGLELVKTAVTCVLMILALVLAFSVVTALRQELNRLGTDPVDSAIVVVPTPSTQTTPGTTDVPAPEATPNGAAAPVPTLAATTTTNATENTGTVRQSANVRSVPTSAQNNPIGKLNPGDQIIFLGVTGDRQWYHVRLGTQHADASNINSADGTGWVNQALLSPPNGIVPLEEVNLPAAPVPTATP